PDIDRQNRPEGQIGVTQETDSGKPEQGDEPVEDAERRIVDKPPEGARGDRGHHHRRKQQCQRNAAPRKPIAAPEEKPEEESCDGFDADREHDEDEGAAEIEPDRTVVDDAHIIVEAGKDRRSAAGERKAVEAEPNQPERWNGVPDNEEDDDRGYQDAAQHFTPPKKGNETRM